MFYFIHRFVAARLADIAMHSATKFVSGHSDVMAGVIAVRDERYDLSTGVEECEVQVLYVDTLIKLSHEDESIENILIRSLTMKFLFEFIPRS